MDPQRTIDALNERFAINGSVQFELGLGDLPKINISADGSEAEIYLQGAQITHFQPQGQPPVLWMSRSSRFEQGKPIRGGIPICHPWFGPSTEPSEPAHGFARIMPWSVESVSQNEPGRVAITLSLDITEPATPSRPGHFKLRYRVAVGSNLEVSLETSNVGRQPLALTEALHTYFLISDIRAVAVRGLEHAEYIDQLAERRICRQDEQPIRFTAETDRIYLNTSATCVLEDTGLRRIITVEKSGSQSTIIWNPWIDKAARMPDFGDNEWPGMLCIETANAADNQLVVLPEQSHTVTAAISARSM